MTDEKRQELSDEECGAFRRLPCSFNDMIRAAHNAGRATAFAEGIELCEIYVISAETDAANAIKGETDELRTRW